MRFTALHWIALGGYIVGALLFIKGGNGLLRELTERRSRVAESGRQLFDVARQDLEDLGRSFQINQDANGAYERLLRAQVDGGPDAPAKVAEELRAIEVHTEEMRLQAQRSDSRAEHVASVHEELDEALHGPSATTHERDAKAARALAQSVRSARTDKILTLGGWY